MTFGSANIRTKSSMSDFSIGRSAKRAVSSVGVKAHHSTGKIMGPPRLRDGVSCIDFSGTLYSRLLKTTTWLLFSKKPFVGLTGNARYSGAHLKNRMVEGV